MVRLAALKVLLQLSEGLAALMNPAHRHVGSTHLILVGERAEAGLGDLLQLLCEGAQRVAPTHSLEPVRRRAEAGDLICRRAPKKARRGLRRRAGLAMVALEQGERGACHVEQRRGRWKDRIRLGAVLAPVL